MQMLSLGKYIVCSSEPVFLSSSIIRQSKNVTKKNEKKIPLNTVYYFIYFLHIFCVYSRDTTEPRLLAFLQRVGRKLFNEFKQHANLIFNNSLLFFFLIRRKIFYFDVCLKRDMITNEAISCHGFCIIYRFILFSLLLLHLLSVFRENAKQLRHTMFSCIRWNQNKQIVLKKFLN